MAILYKSNAHATDIAFATPRPRAVDELTGSPRRRGKAVDRRRGRDAPWTLLRRGTSVVSGEARGEVGGRHGLLSGHRPAPPPPPWLTGSSGPARLTGTDRETIDRQRDSRVLR